MEELKQAYETLGLPEDSGKEEVEKKYFLLIRKARASRQKDDGVAEAETIDIDAVNRAYRLILDAEDKKYEKEYTQKTYGKYKKMAGSAQKIDHFFSYYKFHLLGAVALLALIVYGIFAYIDHKEKQAELAKLPPSNLDISFFGDYLSADAFNPDLTPVEKKVLAQFPDWKRITARLTYVPSEIKSDQDTAFIQKSILDLITYKSDLYIMDKANFLKLAKDGGLMKLGAGETSALEKFVSAKGVKSSTEDDPTEQVYGIDLTGSPLLKDLPIQGKQYIASIRSDAKNVGSAVQFIERYAAAEK